MGLLRKNGTIFTLSPSGGSLVSLREFFNKDMGNARSRIGGASADMNSLHPNK